MRSWGRCFRARGQCRFLKEAYGPVWRFLFGWAAFLVIMGGGVATLLTIQA